MSRGVVSFHSGGILSNHWESFSSIGLWQAAGAFNGLLSYTAIMPRSYNKTRVPQLDLGAVNLQSLQPSPRMHDKGGQWVRGSASNQPVKKDGSEILGRSLLIHL